MSTLPLKTEKELMASFFKAVMRVSQISAKLNDDFLSCSIEEELNLVFTDFVYVINSPTVPGFMNLVQRTNGLLQSLGTLHHLNKVSTLDLLNGERELLILKKVLSSVKSLEGFRVKTEKKIVKSAEAKFLERALAVQESPVDKSKVSPRAKLSQPAKMNPIKKQLLEYITSKREVLNLEIFDRMPNLTRRSIKRHLSELISGGYVHRQSEGKKVYYRIKV